MMRTNNVRRSIAIGVITVFLPLSTVGCFGKFELTKKLWRYNRDYHPDKWMVQALGVVLSPFYGGAIVLDAVLFNALEFWTGKNPILASNGATKTVTDADGRVFTLTRVDEDTISVSVANHPDLLLVREDGSVAAFETDGTLLTRVFADSVPPKVAAQ